MNWVVKITWFRGWRPVNLWWNAVLTMDYGPWNFISVCCNIVDALRSIFSFITSKSILGMGPMWVESREHGRPNWTFLAYKLKCMWWTLPQNDNRGFWVAPHGTKDAWIVIEWTLLFKSMADVVRTLWTSTTGILFQ